MQDKLLNFNDLTALKDFSLFKFDQKEVISYEKDQVTQNDITIEMNLNQHLVTRSGYTALDLVSDVGGIQGIALSSMALFLVFWNYNQFDNYLVTRLYKIDSSETDHHSYLVPQLLSNPKDCIRAYLPCCRCYKNNRLERGFVKARE